MDWAVGVTTAPRAGADYLPDCLQSLAAAGWPRPVVFAEPGSPIPSGWSAEFASKSLGPWPNFCRAMATLRRERPAADAYAVFQDDALLAAGCRAWLEPARLGACVPAARDVS